MQKEHSTQPIMKTAHLTMSIELLRMVLANPGDIAARLSYADRCAESASEADRARAGFTDRSPQSAAMQAGLLTAIVAAWAGLVALPPTAS